MKFWIFFVIKKSIRILSVFFWYFFVMYKYIRDGCPGWKISFNFTSFFYIVYFIFLNVEMTFFFALRFCLSWVLKAKGGGDDVKGMGSPTHPFVKGEFLLTLFKKIRCSVKKNKKSYWKRSTIFQGSSYSTLIQEHLNVLIICWKE